MTEITGLSQLQARLKYIQTIGAKRIAGAALRAGAAVLRNAIQSNSPGTIPREVGTRRLKNEGNTQGIVVGLGVARAESRVPRPHGHFLALGTRFITPRPFVRNAISSATSSVATAMKSAAEHALEQLKEE